VKNNLCNLTYLVFKLFSRSRRRHSPIGPLHLVGGGRQLVDLGLDGSPHHRHGHLLAGQRLDEPPDREERDLLHHRARRISHRKLRQSR
jgi:hypothetical protein